MDRGIHIALSKKNYFCTKDQFMHNAESFCTQLIPVHFRNLLITQGHVFLARLLLIIRAIGAYVYLLQVRKPMEHCVLWASSVQQR